MLVHPIDLSQNTFNAIAYDGGASSSSRSEADLQGHLRGDFLRWYQAIDEANTAGCQGPHILPVTVEEGPDQPAMLEPVRTGQTSGTGYGCTGHLPGRLSLTVRRLRPFARRRAINFLPFLVAIRLRKPCVLARLRRLG